MLVVLMWIALFLDVLECFCPMDPRVGPTIQISTPSSSSLSTSSTTQEHHTTVELDSYINVTVKLPLFFHDSSNKNTDDNSDPSSSSSSSSSLHSIYIRPLLSDEEVGMACRLAEDYAEENGRWDQPDSERHESYSTCDFPVDECTELETFLESSDFEQRLFQQFSDLYNIDVNDLSYNDLFVAYYQGKKENQQQNGDNDNEDDADYTNSNIMDRLELHRDGSLLSFSLLLNPPNEFEGGGTFYDALRDVKPTFEDGGILHPGGAIRPNRAGDAVLHCGKILHGADVVTSGRRIVLVGFVDVSKRCIRPGALGNSCKEWGRMDVAKFRLKRQEKKNHRGWVLNNSRWLQDVTNNAVVRGFVPASSGVIRRADPELCRRRRLEMEDLLLRNIILPSDERGPKDDEYHQFSWDNEGAISILDNELEEQDRI